MIESSEANQEIFTGRLLARASCLDVEELGSDFGEALAGVVLDLKASEFERVYRGPREERRDKLEAAGVVYGQFEQMDMHEQHTRLGEQFTKEGEEINNAGAAAQVDFIFKRMVYLGWRSDVLGLADETAAWLGLPELSEPGRSL